LAIIDLSEAGFQPMESADGTVVIVYNGEIYNFEALRKELLDYPYKGYSDTEVILAAYQKWGKKAFERLNGIFALALFDKRSRELLVVRDRAGIKPLYYFFDGTNLIFSSEIKGILVHDIPRTLDHDAFMHYLRVLYTPAPYTMFKNIRKLEPGGMLTFKENKIHIESYVLEEKGNAPEISDKGLHEVVEAAVKRQLVSDRPIGVYLSGGFDSSIVLNCASRVHGAINTFSVGFDLGKNHPREGTFNADSALARKTAAFYGATHHEILLSVEDARNLFQKAILHLDEPIGNATVLPMLHLAEFTKPLATVVLGGDGGDELFGGYERYRLSLLSTYYRKVPQALRAIANRIYPRLCKLDTSPGIERFMQFLFQKDTEVQRILSTPTTLSVTRDFFEEKFFSRPSDDFESVFMDTDRQSWLVDECLMRTDKMAMASAVEVRVPFLDNEVVDFASRIPRNEKVTLFETKRMLKRTFKNDLPPFLYGQPKRGWFSPGGEWIKMEPFSTMVDDILSPSYYEGTAALFNWEEVKKMLETHRDGREYHMVMLWAILTFQAWAKTYKVHI
ncbi:asparagine synthase (glutamine-hydrolyzing), partial [Acetobacteraceae bacterium]|nr:asparagine synthase (glutamine-hydrolyzing) [Candidatus Parcubacteria bacterium]